MNFTKNETILKAVATSASIGDLTTLEDESSIEEVKNVNEKLKKEVLDWSGR